MKRGRSCPHRNLSTLWTVICVGFLALEFLHAQSQSNFPSGLYQITSGTFVQCCGFAGATKTTLPNPNQRFVKLAINDSDKLAAMSILGQDAGTVFSISPCPPNGLIDFKFDFGFFSFDRIIFHVDPGPTAYHTWWNYTVTNANDVAPAGKTAVSVNGTLGTAAPPCADVPTQFTYSNLVAVLIAPPRLTFKEYSKTNGVELMVQGEAGRTNIVLVSTNLVTWSPISTNYMPPTLCPICPYVLVRDYGSTNPSAASRYYWSYDLLPP